ncbi:MAG: thermonuclease family protein [Acidimicrobiia bacterium]
MLSGHRVRCAFAALSVLTCVGLVACRDATSSDDTVRTTTRPSPTTVTTMPAAYEVPAGEDAVVASVTDGDTIRVLLASRANEPVRLIGIDTPETRDPRTVVECFGKEATRQTTKLVPPGTRVRLVKDVEARDRYDRMLAYVYRLDDGVFVNEKLVADGWAAPYRYPPNVRFADRFSALGRTAREHGVGLWGACGGPDTPAS